MNERKCHPAAVPPRPASRIGVDIGGTFTDFVLERGAEQVSLKLFTTPEAPERAVMQGIDRLLAELEIAPNDVAMVVHGTTLATNALIERRGAKVGFVTTEGFRDTLEMAYEHRYDQYDLLIDKPRPLVERALRQPVRERIAADGSVLKPLDVQQMHAVAATLGAAGVEAVAVGFLHSYANPDHEAAAGEILRATLPGVPVTLSADVSPELREYERFTTAVANAYVQPLMARYLVRLDAALRARGLRCPLYLMQSNGGLCDLETACRTPVRLMESGPAGGAIFGAAFATELGLERALLLDIGGTTAKLCFLDEGRPSSARSMEVARIDRFKPGSGLPLRLPVIELCEIGAGGGSLAAVDRLGRLTVGPQGAGAMPGPACYGRGGDLPTVTDAQLVLRRIDPSRFADGMLQLQAAPSMSALAREIGAKLSIPAEAAALGVIEIVNENMARAAREHAIEQGRGVEGRTLIAIGGAAALHAADLAAKLGMGDVVVPRAAGVGSAIGFLRAPIACEKSWSHHQLLSRFAPARAAASLDRLVTDVETILLPAANGAPPCTRVSAQMRYRGQSGELTVPFERNSLSTASLREAFEAVYARFYGRTLDGDVELLGFSARAELPPDGGPAAVSGAPPAPGGPTPWSFVDQRTGETVQGLRIDRQALAVGAKLSGPAIVVDVGTTILVPSGMSAEVLHGGHLRLRRENAA